MGIYRLGDAVPRIAATVYVAPGARVIGRVVLDEHSSVWFGAVLRADLDAIHIGAGSNVQDNAVLHVNAGEPCHIGRDVTIGHGAVVHGCVVEDECLIGMGAVVLSRARIGRGSLVGAGALVPEGKDIPPGSLVLGVPARVVRSLTPEEQAEIRAAAARYRENARRFAQTLEPLAAPGIPPAAEPDTAPHPAAPPAAPPATGPAPPPGAPAQTGPEQP